MFSAILVDGMSFAKQTAAFNVKEAEAMQVLEANALQTNELCIIAVLQIATCNALCNMLLNISQHRTQCIGGISFAKQAAVINASVSDIYRRLEGRRGRGEEIVFKQNKNSKLNPTLSYYFCVRRYNVQTKTKN